MQNELLAEVANVPGQRPVRLFTIHRVRCVSLMVILKKSQFLEFFEAIEIGQNNWSTPVQPPACH